MNKRSFKRIMSLVLVVVMAVSTMMVSAVSTSADTGNAEYKFEFKTAGSLGTSGDLILIKVNGENGSTSWHNVRCVANEIEDSCSFFDINIGNIKSITVKNIGFDGWYPETIKYTKQNGGERFTTTLYGGRWVDDGKEVVFSVTDRVAQVTVKTGNYALISGTNSDIDMCLIDDKGKSTCYLNLSNIHPELNAFERYDKSTFYIHVPDDFGELREIMVRNDGSNSYGGWYLDYVDVTLDGERKIFPCNEEILSKKLETTGYLYKVTVKTSEKFLAGTDGDVNLYAYDENGNPITRKNYIEDVNYYYLDNESNNFEKGDTDIFYIALPQKIGSIKMACDDIFSDDIFWDSFNKDWHLDYVQLDLIDGDNVAKSTKYNFQKWIGGYNKLYEPTSKEVLL